MSQRQARLSFLAGRGAIGVRVSPRRFLTPTAMFWFRPRSLEVKLWYTTFALRTRVSSFHGLLRFSLITKHSTKAAVRENLHSIIFYSFPCVSLQSRQPDAKFQ